MIEIEGIYALDSIKKGDVGMADFEMRHISKSFGNVHALEKANFSADKGDVMGLLGENGAGKSTLIKILCGVEKEDEGEVVLFGKPMLRRSPREAMEEGVRVVHQELSLIPNATVAENLFITEEEGVFSRRTLKSLKEKANALFEKYKVTDIDANAYVGDISLAKCQKIEILKALAFEFDILVLDEATSALTEKDVEWLFDLIKKLSAEGKIIIFISHRLQEINSICNRITIFRNGTSVCESTKDELDTDQMVTLMLGRKMAGYYPPRSDCMTDEVLLHVEDLRNNELNGVSFDLHAGEILGVGGLSGQGQAALFEALYGAEPAAGKIAIRGKEHRIHYTSAALKNGIALIPEDRGKQGLALPLSVKENISLASLKKIRKGMFLSAARENKLVQEMMEKLQIKADTPEVPVVTLSGGNQQKVVLAKQLLVGPDILLMYDITRGVDVGTKREMFNLMLEHCKEGKAILFFSTDTEELVHMCNSIYVMFEGKFKAHLQGDAMTEENIIRVSVGEAAV
jgi:ABC-type sugar transport system ATPase subunit